MHLAVWGKRITGLGPAWATNTKQVQGWPGLHRDTVFQNRKGGKKREKERENIRPEKMVFPVFPDSRWAEVEGPQVQD